MIFFTQRVIECTVHETSKNSILSGLSSNLGIFIENVKNFLVPMKGWTLDSIHDNVLYFMLTSCLRYWTPINHAAYV